MKERPILFSAPMVRAILTGQKTQTRRVVKHIPALGCPDEWKSLPDPRLIGDIAKFCPYGNTSDRLWVRETWKATPEHKPIPNAHSYPKYWYRATDCLPTWAPDGGWKPSIYPKRMRLPRVLVWLPNTTNSGRRSTARNPGVLALTCGW